MEKARFSAAFQKYQWLWKACFMGLLPLLCAAVMCWAQGFSLGRIYLPASGKNDELFYFKQVEGIVRGGFPLGYFGFNESHALVGSFGAWSPVLYLPWTLWGFLFGWTLMSPIYCNIALTSLALFCFVLLSRPTGRQLAAMAVLFCAFIPNIRYMLSGMAEPICLDILIIFYGFAVEYLRHGEQGWKLAGMFAAAVLLTLMRPYMLLCLLLPAGLWIHKGRNFKTAALAAVVIVLTLGCYAAVSHYLQASYFTPIINVQWLQSILHGDLAGGVGSLASSVWEKARRLAVSVLRGSLRGEANGAYHVCYFAVFVAASEIFLRAARRRDQKDMILYGYLIFSLIGMVAALFLAYNPLQGRHILSFIGAGLLLVGMGEEHLPWKSALLTGLCILFFQVCGRSTPDYVVPFEDDAHMEAMDYWTDTMEGQMLLEGDVPSFENTVIWVSSDYVFPNGDERSMDMGSMYAVPAGFGVSLCMGDFVRDNLDVLQSRYILTVAGGQIDEMCREAGYKELGRHTDIVCYIRY